MNHKVGERVRIIAKSRGVTNKFLAEKAGVTDSKMSLILNGKQEIGCLELFRISEALHVPMKEFCRESKFYDNAYEKEHKND